MENKIFYYFLNLINKINNKEKISAEDLKNIIIFYKKLNLNKETNKIIELAFELIDENTLVLQDEKDKNFDFLYFFVNEHMRKLRKF